MLIEQLICLVCFQLENLAAVPHIVKIACNITALEQLIQGQDGMDISTISQIMCTYPGHNWYSAMQSAGILPVEITKVADEVNFLTTFNATIKYMFCK